MKDAIATLGEMEARLHLVRERLVRLEKQHAEMFGALKRIASGTLSHQQCIDFAAEEVSLAEVAIAAEGNSA
jgi:hypothetical protein